MKYVHWTKRCSNQCFILWYVSVLDKNQVLLPVQITTDSFANISESIFHSAGWNRIYYTTLWVFPYSTDVMFRYFVTPQKHVFPSTAGQTFVFPCNSSLSQTCWSLMVFSISNTLYSTVDESQPSTQLIFNSFFNNVLCKTSQDVWMYEYMNVAQTAYTYVKENVCIFILNEHADYWAARHKRDCKYVN